MTDQRIANAGYRAKFMSAEDVARLLAPGYAA